ncbi:MAG: leucyl aminopeptidase family protein [Anaerolineaceae bacterium]|nr:leucyl aminopeptidase family protein [Anaerolineaceae bacterium]
MEKKSLQNIGEYTNSVKIFVKQKAQLPIDVQLFLAFGVKEPRPGEIGAEVGQILSGVLEAHQTKAIVSLGEREKINLFALRNAGASISMWLNQFHKTTSILHISSIENLNDPDMLGALFEGLFLGSYTFSKRKTGGRKAKEINIYLDTSLEAQKVQSILEHARILTEAVNLARDWAHEPANIINPVSLSEWVQVLAQKNGLHCKIFDETALSEMQAGGILSVGQGSKTLPRLIVLEYPGTPPTQMTKPVVLVGKAITFDTGGYSLKDTTNIQNMKYDKSGGIVVAAVLQAAATLQIKKPVVGIIAAAENMISPQAYRPDDIITTLSGKTIEIISTDAEGRLVLADALTYAQQNYTPEAIIDLATLTGGVVVALGRLRAGLMSNSDTLASALTVSGDRTAERLWRLPLDDEYFHQIEGDDADLRNSGGREASSIIGGMFLKQFVADQIPWAHIDIAGVAASDKPSPLGPKGATGFGVRLLTDFLERI